MKTKTSIHNLNADKKRSISDRILWILLNLINNTDLTNKADSLCIKHFCPEINDEDWKKIQVKSSPSRVISDLFWLKLDWESIKSELGSVNVFDTGAGKGGYALKINDFAKGISKYHGVDSYQHKEWEFMRKFNFITMKQMNSNNILEEIPNKTNFFMSQSAIEHFENDLLYFDQIKNFINKTGNNTIQVHLFPSAACLKLYPWHGVRQYTPNTISTIVQLFNSKNTYSMLFNLGGKHCNKLHYHFITQPKFTKKEDWRESKTDEYRDRLKIAVEKDIAYKNNHPSFYALVVHSNFDKPIFNEMKSLTKRCT